MEQETLQSGTIVCLGDSITFGMGVAQPERDAWPAILEQRLGEQWQVVNLGVSGTTLMDEAHAPYRATGKVDQAKEIPFNIAFIMIGTNDAFDPAWDAALYTRALEALLHEIQDAGKANTGALPQIILMAPPAVFFGPERYINDSVPPERMGGELRGIIKQVARDCGARYIDLYAFTEEHPEWFPDQLHPHEEANLAMGNYLFEQVFSQLNES